MPISALFVKWSLQRERIIAERMRLLRNPPVRYSLKSAGSDNQVPWSRFLSMRTENDKAALLFHSLLFCLGLFALSLPWLSDGARIGRTLFALTVGLPLVSFEGVQLWRLMLHKKSRAQTPKGNATDMDDDGR